MQVLLATGQPYTMGGSLCVGCQLPGTLYSPNADLLDVDTVKAYVLPISQPILSTGDDNFYVHMVVLPTGMMAMMDSRAVMVSDCC